MGLRVQGVRFRVQRMEFEMFRERYGCFINDHSKYFLVHFFDQKFVLN